MTSYCHIIILWSWKSKYITATLQRLSVFHTYTRDISVGYNCQKDREKMKVHDQMLMAT